MKIEEYLEEIYTRFKDEKCMEGFTLYGFKCLQGEEPLCLKPDGTIDFSKVRNILLKYGKENQDFQNNTCEFNDEIKNKNMDKVAKEKFIRDEIDNVENQEKIKEKRCIIDNILKQVFNNIEKLDEKYKQRLFATCLLIANEIEYNSGRAPSKFSKELSNKYKGHHIDAEQKQKDQWKKDYPSGFWQKFKEKYSKKIDYSGVEQAKELYKEYKKSFSKNHRRDVKMICEEIFKGIDDTLENNKIKGIIQKDITNFSHHPNLKEIEEKAQILPHDRDTKYSLPCDFKYLKAIFVLAQAHNKNKVIGYKEEIEHIKSCSKCYSCYTTLIESIEYRRDHLDGRERLFFQRNPHNDERYEQFNEKETKRLARGLVSKYVKKQNKNTEGNKEMTEMIDYEITVGCICGNINKYNFNHLRIQEIPFGRQDEEGNYSYINVCEDDVPFLSRKQCCFMYDERKEDWYIKAEEEKRKSIYYITKENMKELLDKKEARTVNKEKLKCQNISANAFSQLGSDKMYLSDIDLLCFMPTSSTPLSFKGEEKHGIFHPVLGNLPFGWYIDIVDRRSFKNTVESYIKRTMVNRKTTIVSTKEPKETKVRK